MKWYHRVLRYPEVWVLTVAALLTRLWHLGWPHSIVFDEVYFREFPSNYLSGEYYFDVHPPFIKLVFTGVAALFQLTPDQTAVGEPGSLILRVLPALAGAALVPLVYIILRQLRLNRYIATLGAALVLLDNALLVESRFVLMDSLLLLAGFGAFSAYLALRQHTGATRWVWLGVVGILSGIVVSTKWSGLAIVGFIALIWLVDGIRHRIMWHRLLAEAVAVVAIIGTIYTGSFMVHFALLDKSGEGDAFMSERFQSTLVNNPYHTPGASLPFPDKFIELNQEMYSAQNSLNSTTHPYSSKWYGWPLMADPVYYWQGSVQANGLQGHIYLLGNPIVWVLGTVLTFMALVFWLVIPKSLGKYRHVIACLLLGYGLNFIPFAFIDRPMFLYHYLYALVFSILIASVMLAVFFDWQTKQYGQKTAIRTLLVFGAVVLIAFLYFLPLSYGWPLSPVELNRHMLLSNWR